MVVVVVVVVVVELSIWSSNSASLNSSSSSSSSSSGGVHYVKLDPFPNFRGENKKHLKPPPKSHHCKFASWANAAFLRSVACWSSAPMSS